MSITPDSSISSMRSLPSRVRSPTPQKTETPRVLLGHVVDELLDEHGLADAGTAEEADLAALHVRSDQVDDLDPRLEDLRLRLELLELGRVAMDRPALAGRCVLAVDRVADHVPEPPQRLVSDRHADRAAEVDDLGPAGEPVGRVHGDGAHAIVAQVLLHLGDQLATLDRDPQRAVDLREGVREDGVDDDALDLDQLSDVLAVRTLLRHATPGEGFQVSGGA